MSLMAKGMARDQREPCGPPIATLQPALFAEAGVNLNGKFT
jgi:hypothetical protein